MHKNYKDYLSKDSITTGFLLEKAGSKHFCLAVVLKSAKKILIRIANMILLSKYLFRFCHYN